MKPNKAKKSGSVAEGSEQDRLKQALRYKSLPTDLGHQSGLDASANKFDSVVEAAEQERLKQAAIFNSLPTDLGRSRVLDAKAAAAYWGVSLPHWRRQYRAGKVPAPIRVGERKLGWRIGDLADGLAARLYEPAA